MRMVLKNNQLVIILLSGIMLFSSLSKMFPFNVNYFDELFFVGILFVVLFNEKKIIVDFDVKLAIVYVVLSVVVVCINRSSWKAYMLEFMNNIKIILVFVIFTQIKFSDKDRDKLFKIFIVINIPSIMYSVYQYVNRGQGLALGLKVRGGVARITGYAGHPIWYAFIMLLIIIILIEMIGLKSKKRMLCNLQWNILVLGSLLVCVVLLEATKSRYPLALLCMVLLIWVLKYLKKRTRIAVLFIGILVAIFIAVIGIEFLRKFVEAEITSVRMQGLLNIPKAIVNYPLGSGIGTFGSKGSVLYKSDVYSTLGLNMPNLDRSFNQGNLYESTLVQRIVEMGLIGTGIYFAVFSRALKYWKYCKDCASVLILLVFVLNAVFNAGYQLPLIVLAGVSYSNLKYNYSEYKRRRRNDAESIHCL